MLIAVAIADHVWCFKYVPMYGAQIAFKDYKFNLGIIRSPWVGFDPLSYSPIARYIVPC